MSPYFRSSLFATVGFALGIGSAQPLGLRWQSPPREPEVVFTSGHLHKAEPSGHSHRPVRPVAVWVDGERRGDPLAETSNWTTTAYLMVNGYPVSIHGEVAPEE